LVINPYSEFPQELQHPVDVNVYNPQGILLLALATIIIIAVIVTAICVAKKINKK